MKKSTLQERMDFVEGGNFINENKDPLKRKEAEVQLGYEPEFKELLVEFSGEGGSLSIYRFITKKGTYYLSNVSETDFSGEIGDLDFSEFARTFEGAMYPFFDNYPIHCLYPTVVHPEVIPIFKDAFLNYLNNLDEKEKMFFPAQNKYEKVLNCRFELDKSSRFNGLYEIDVTPLFESVAGIDKSPIYRFGTEGQVEIQYNSILIKDAEGKLEFILPADKYVVETRAIYETVISWVILENK